jgi:hypothetical protein
MAEKLILSHFGAPLMIVYEPGRACLVYTSGKANLQTIQADLKEKCLSPLGPLETVEQIFETHQRISERPNLFGVVNSRPILIANDFDIWTSKGVRVGGNNLLEPMIPVAREDIGEYIQDIKRLKENPYLRAKYTLSGIELLTRLGKRKKRLNEKSCIYCPQVSPGMSEDSQLMTAQALDISGNRFYFNGAFQNFSNCCVFGKVCSPLTDIPLEPVGFVKMVKSQN